MDLKHVKIISKFRVRLASKGNWTLLGLYAHYRLYALPCRTWVSSAQQGFNFVFILQFSKFKFLLNLLLQHLTVSDAPLVETDISLICCFWQIWTPKVYCWEIHEFISWGLSKLNVKVNVWSHSLSKFIQISANIFEWSPICATKTILEALSGVCWPNRNQASLGFLFPSGQVCRTEPNKQHCDRTR